MKHNPFCRLTRRGKQWQVKVLIVLIAGCPSIAAAGDNGRIHWRPIDRGHVRLDDKQPLKTAVYQPEKSQKKPNLVLILLGHRWLALDIKARKVYQVMPADLEVQGPNLESGDLFKDERLVPSKDWTERDVGPAERIRLTLNDYGRQLEINLPHPADLRAFY
ncbi:MAG TPA: hypothetical protein VMG82_31295 [Candidatus Sulfotelmatobacter sp.]|nr:hypothetical protein [Candidatus Sulfotelmatobacter sp.]